MDDFKKCQFSSGPGGHKCRCCGPKAGSKVDEGRAARGRFKAQIQEGEEATMSVYVVVTIGDPDPIAVYAGSPQEAARMVILSGPYSFADTPPRWSSRKSVSVEVTDDDG